MFFISARPLDSSLIKIKGKQPKIGIINNNFNIFGLICRPARGPPHARAAHAPAHAHTRVQPEGRAGQCVRNNLSSARP